MATLKLLHGILPLLPTPFDEDGVLDPEEIEHAERERLLPGAGWA